MTVSGNHSPSPGILVYILEHVRVPEDSRFTRFDNHSAGGLRIKFVSHSKTEKSSIESLRVNSKKMNQT